MCIISIYKEVEYIVIPGSGLFKNFNLVEPYTITVEELLDLI